MKELSKSKRKQLPLELGSGSKRETRAQFAALPFRVVDGIVQFLLVTSRTRKRWILPKGWPEPGMTPAQTVEIEAYEEAGAKGKGHPYPIGVYSYEKFTDDGALPVVASVYPLEVKKTKRKYPEAAERRRKWFTQEKAAKKVDEKELKRIIKSFDVNSYLQAQKSF